MIYLDKSDLIDSLLLVISALLASYFVQFSCADHHASHSCRGLRISQVHFVLYVTWLKAPQFSGLKCWLYCYVCSKSLLGLCSAFIYINHSKRFFKRSASVNDAVSMMYMAFFVRRKRNADLVIELWEKQTINNCLAIYFFR